MQEALKKGMKMREAKGSKCVGNLRCAFVRLYAFVYLLAQTRAGVHNTSIEEKAQMKIRLLADTEDNGWPLWRDCIGIVDGTFVTIYTIRRNNFSSI